MFASDLVFVRANELPVEHDLFTGHVETIHRMRPREDQPSHGIVCAAELEEVRAPDGEVGALARRKLTNVVTAEDRGAAPRRQAQSLSRRHCFRPAASARDEQRLFDLEEEIASFIRGGAVDSEADPYVCIQEVT